MIIHIPLHYIYKNKDKIITITGYYEDGSIIPFEFHNIIFSDVHSLEINVVCIDDEDKK